MAAPADASPAIKLATAAAGVLAGMAHLPSNVQSLSFLLASIISSLSIPTPRPHASHAAAAAAEGFRNEGDDALLILDDVDTLSQVGFSKV